MKRKHFRNSWLIIAMLFAVVACKEKEDAFEVDADVIFIRKKINDEIVNATGYYAYGNKSLASATATIPNGGGTIDLEAYESYTYTFVNEPDDEDFSTDFPIMGSYSFDVSNTNGETVEAFDEQEYSNLGLAEMDSLNFDEDDFGLYVGWNEVSGADQYIVRLFNTSGEMIFNGYTIDADSPEYFVSYYYTVGTWAEAPVKGQNYKLRIQSIKYDADATNDNYVYNIQEVTMTDISITWLLD